MWGPEVEVAAVGDQDCADNAHMPCQIRSLALRVGARFLNAWERMRRGVAAQYWRQTRFVGVLVYPPKAHVELLGMRNACRSEFG